MGEAMNSHNRMELHPVCIRTRKGWYVIEVQAVSMYEAIKRAEKMPHVSRAKASDDGWSSWVYKGGLLK